MAKAETKQLDGYTTGTCAAAAAKAAAARLLGRPATAVTVTLPDGGVAELPVVESSTDGVTARAAVRKISPEAEDVTHGIVIRAAVSRHPGSEIIIEGGEGVGVATAAGLAVPKGEAAINPVPREMIRRAVRETADGGLRVVIEVPGGAALAEKTFNPRLGIRGGISIIGTSGRVKKWDRASFIASMECCLNVAFHEGSREFVVLVPGRRGERAFLDEFGSVNPVSVVQMGNFAKEALLAAGARGFGRIVLAGHPGKLAKLALGEYDTHHGSAGMPLEIFRQAAAESALALPAAPGTIEELIADLPDDGRRLLDRVAELTARRCARDFPGAEYTVIFYDLNGRAIGGSDRNIGDWFSSLQKSRSFTGNKQGGNNSG